MMARYARIKNGVVVNVVLFDTKPQGNVFVASDVADIGWTYADGVLTPPEVTSEPLPMPNLSPRQLRLALSIFDISADAVTQTIEGINDPTERELASIEWTWATQFERSNPLLLMVGQALNLTEEQIDTMWKQALAL